MGHREVKRVPLDFSWPLKKTWEGYLMPQRLHEGHCPDCEHGYSPRGEYLGKLWYGHASFQPEDTGSPRLTADTPVVRAFAERNVGRDPQFYGEDPWAVIREAQRLAAMWNGQWCHHLTQEDVDALVAGGRLMDFTHTCTRAEGWKVKDPPYAPTAAEVNEWSVASFGHDAINRGIAISARCAREGVSDTCATCGGDAYLEAYPGQRAEAEAWECEEPPAGEGWQLWETTSEGSPVSPVFATAEELADWCEDGATVFGHDKWTREQWLASFTAGSTDADSLFVTTGDFAGTLGDLKARDAAAETEAAGTEGDGE